MLKFGQNYTPKKTYQKVSIDSIDENIKEDEQPMDAASDASRRLHLLNLRIQSEEKQK